MPKSTAKILVCENCQKDISEPTEVVDDSTKNIDQSSPAEDYHTTIGKTVRYTVDGPYQDELLGSNFYRMNGHNLLTRVKPIEGTTGCCGYSGINNMQCVCGNVVGTLYTDCTGPHFFRPLKKETYFSTDFETSSERYEKLIERNKRYKKSR